MFFEGNRDVKREYGVDLGCEGWFRSAFSQLSGDRMVMVRVNYVYQWMRMIRADCTHLDCCRDIATVRDCVQKVQ